MYVSFFAEGRGAATQTNIWLLFCSISVYSYAIGLPLRHRFAADVGIDPFCDTCFCEVNSYSIISDKHQKQGELRVLSDNSDSSTRVLIVDAAGVRHDPLVIVDCLHHAESSGASQSGPGPQQWLPRVIVEQRCRCLVGKAQVVRVIIWHAVEWFPAVEPLGYPLNDTHPFGW